LPINLANICGCFLFAYVIFLFVWHSDDIICKISFPALMIYNNSMQRKIVAVLVVFWGVYFRGGGVTCQIYLYFVITFICWFTTKSHLVYEITKYNNNSLERKLRNSSENYSHYAMFLHFVLKCNIVLWGIVGAVYCCVKLKH
jgi:hypothetical protein